MNRIFRSFSSLMLLAMVLSACGSKYNITYSGHEESTEGVPGFINGKKTSPNIKLGQSYSIDGETYVPRHQPDYREEGMASWYGPGFHGGKTANGEVFDKHSMTAAHRTLPLPSIVKVTLLSTGKSAYVRVNDRGPYAHSRIIDLSYAAAKEIGMLGKGTGKVRVEYKLAESQRFASLLAQGRKPESIDLAEEVLPYGNTPDALPQYASNDAFKSRNESGKSEGLLSKFNPIADANATDAPANMTTMYNDDSIAVESTDLLPPTQAIGQKRAQPVNVANTSATPPILAVQPYAQSPPIGGADAVFIQLGSFSQRENVLRLQNKVSSVGAVTVVPKTVGTQLLYRIRMGPYTASRANEQLAKLQALGLNGMVLIRE